MTHLRVLRALRGEFLLLLLAAPALAQPAITIDRASYPDRLRAMWLGECIADWTGLTTEGARIDPPFFTDADWGTTPPGGQRIDFVFQDPWEADDNTDVEYVYLNAMHNFGRCLLSPDEIRQAWLDHMDPNYIWVSDLRAYQLMQRGLRPPMTGAAAANGFWSAIDAQLTTEFFGAFCPGMPEEALRYADLPIHTTADGFAAHAAQFYVILHALAPMVDANLSGRDKALWLTRQGRKYIPDTSKSADIIDFVLADFLANPDPQNWELTRDRIYDRYQLHANQNGFAYNSWVESSINFACGVLALLYGECDYRRTVQIAILAGWDSDDQAATLGGILGLMLGYDALASQFPGQSLSDRYNIHRTRIGLPDYLPDDPDADDTFTLMAQRMMPLVDSCIIAAGGSVDTANNRWRLPPAAICSPLNANLGERLMLRSANHQVGAAGGQVSPTSSATGHPPDPIWVYGSGDVGFFSNVIPPDFAGRDTNGGTFFYSTQNSGQGAGTVQTLTVTYDRAVEVYAVRFIEGDHFGLAGDPPSPNGGWFTSATVQVLVGGQWTTPQVTPSEPLDAAKPFQVIDFVLASPVQATAIRISGPCGGADGFVTCAELDALSSPLPLLRMNARRAH